jgi:Rieske Fe-S protein
MTNGTVAAMVISDGIRGRENSWASFYDPGRLGSLLTKTLVGENLNVVKHRVGDRLSLPGKEILADLGACEGAVCRIEGEPTAVSRTEDGGLLAVSALCTHMGCVVAWNPAEQSWDCPCHGSRFLPDGTLIQGPATANLELTPLAP